MLLAQTEVAEVAEGGARGGSSAMPHKHNPVAAISARACARRAPGLVATLFGAMEQEHERAAGAWHSEWPTLTGLLATVGSAAAWLAESLDGLRPDTPRMAATVAAARDPELAGALADALTPALGRGAAHDAAADAVREAAASGRPLREVLAGRTDVDVSTLLAGRARHRGGRRAGRRRPRRPRPTDRGDPSERACERANEQSRRNETDERQRGGHVTVAVSYTAAGPEDAPVVVLSNSLGADPRHVGSQVPALAERYRVVTFDTRGHGESPAPPGPYSLDDLVDDLVALLDEVGAERAHVAGLSLGGMIAMRLAAREPARLDRLALLCTSAHSRPGSPRRARDAGPRRGHRRRRAGGRRAVVHPGVPRAGSPTWWPGWRR